MPRTRPPYTPELRQQMVELVRAGRKLGDLANEFGCTAPSIANWVARSQRHTGVPSPCMNESPMDKLTNAGRTTTIPYSK